MWFRIFAASIFIVFSILSMSAQQEVTIHVLDKQGDPIEGVIVSSRDHVQQKVTDRSGTIYWPFKYESNDTIYFNHLNYLQKNVGVLELKNFSAIITLEARSNFLEPAEIISSWVNKNSAIVHSTIDLNKIQTAYIVQDVPYLLQHLPSTYSTSDAGNGIGYSALRIRGLDPSQINVLINGVSFNDAESQTAYWVDLPDIIASASDIQVQRGIGLSGAGQVAFGSSILINTNRFNPKPHLEFETAVGSFKTMRTTILFGSGNLLHHWNIEGRLSKIYSDGYIDRANSNLYAGALSISKILSRRSFKLHLFDGLENTYQAWNGVPVQYIDGPLRTFNTSGTEKSPSPYSNQIDRYRQTNFQFIHREQLGINWSMQNTLHYTPGYGYYEEYKSDQDPTKYKLIGDQMIDIVRRRLLENDFVGSIHTAEYEKLNSKFTLGTAWNYYHGRHIGQVIEVAGSILSNKPEYYNQSASKWTGMVFGKLEVKLNKLSLLSDMQLRNINYHYVKESNQQESNTVRHYFFCPKIGFTWQPVTEFQLFGFLGLAYREPNREDYVKADALLPRPERLLDHEVGLRFRTASFQLEQTFYYMNYKDQLIPTGRLNDVGSYVRTNVAKSSRVGTETSVSWSPLEHVTFNSNVNFSSNVTREFIEYLDNWDNQDQETIVHRNQPIAFSPAHILNFEVAWDALRLKTRDQSHQVRLSIGYQSIGRQYLDGTGNKEALLPGYSITRLNITYLLSKRNKPKASLLLQVNNLWNTSYESNGWIYRFKSPSYNPVADDPYAEHESMDLYHQKGLFPQAGRNVLLGLKIYLASGD